MTTQQRYKICIVLLVIALIGAISATLIMKSKKKPQVAKDPVEMESAEIRNYFESKEFAQLPIEQKVKFVESIPENRRRELMRPPRPPKDGEKPQMPNQNMRQQMRKIMEYQMEQRLNAFFAASEAEQNRMLDEDINRMKKMRAEMNQRRAERQKRQQNNSGSNGGNGNNETKRPERPKMDEQSRRDIEASMSPATRAKMRVYMEKMRQREQQQQKK